METIIKRTAIKEEAFAFFLAFILMFGYPFNMYIEFFLAAVCAIILHSQKDSESLRFKNQSLLLICGFVWSLSCLYSCNSLFALKYMFLYFCVYVIVIRVNTEVFSSMLKYLLLFGGIHIAFILFDFFDHGSVLSIASKFLNSDQIDMNNQLRTYSGACSGLTGQTGQAALFVVVFMYAAVARSNEKKVFLLLLIPAIIALLLTQKRSFLGFGVLFSMGGVICEFKNAGIWAKAIMIILVCIAIFAIQYYIEYYFDISAITEKIEEGSMSNRDILWKRMYFLFSNNPIFGIGLYSTDTILGMTGHNIYIQLLCENGIFGSVFFFTLFVKAMLLTLKRNVNDDIVSFSRLTILFILAYGLFGNPIYEIQTLALFYIAITVLDRTANRNILIRKKYE